MTDLVFLKALRDKLKGGNSRSIHLNALPGKFATRLDLADLNVVKPHLADAFLQQLFTTAKFEFPIDFHDDPAHIRPADEQKKLHILARRLNAICIENDDNFKEQGIRTFGFGYPILVKRTRQDPDKVIKAPLFIWPLEILKAHDKVNSWSVLRNKTLNENNRIVDEELHSVAINEVLLSFLRTDENIVLPQINEELLEDAIIDKDELLSLLLGVLRAFHATDTVSQSVLAAKLAAPVALIPDAGELEASTGAQPWIQFSGVFGLFRTQKESIISDMDKLIDNHTQFGKPPVIHITQPLSPYAIVDTDPSQQEILHTLLDAPHKIIQGPPGTGKSQSLTALITNALSNGMKCLVVCEKKTALDVIKSNLEKTGEQLGALSVVIEDIIKDRDKIINAVRDRIAQQQANGHTVNEHPYLQSKSDIDQTIREINTQHAALYAPLYNGKNWTTLVGEFLAMKAQTDIEPLKEKLDHRKFKFEDDPQELHIFRQHLHEAQRLYAEVNSLEHPLDILHSRLFTGENPRLVQQELELFLQKNLLEANALSESLKALKAAYGQALQDYYTTLAGHVQPLYGKLLEEASLYGQALTQHYTRYYQSVKTAVDDYLDFSDNAYREFGKLFYKNDGFSKFLLQLGSVFSGKYKRMTAARAQLHTRYNAVQAAHRQYDYFSHAYLPLQEMPSLQVLPDDIRHLKAELEQWGAGIDALKRTWMADFSPSHAHPVYTSNVLQQCWKAYVALRSRIGIDPVLQSRYGVQAAHTQELLSLLQGLLADITPPTALITHYIDRCTSAYLHGAFKNSQPQVVQLENDTNAFWSMFQESQLFQRNVVPPEPLTLPLRMNAMSRLWLEMDVVRQQLPNFRSYFAWRRFFEPLPALEQEVIRIMAVSGYPQWAESFSAWYYNWLLSHLENLSLPTNDAAIQRLRFLQEGLKKLQQEQIVAQWQQRQAEAVQQFTDHGLSVAGLYNKRGNKGQRRNSLRKIVASDVALFTSFFPVLMVSPSVCSSILPLEEGLFD
ncbi:MAG TPA: AAA domain-containing protein, partial [Chitinophaga sp.]